MFLSLELTLRTRRTGTPDLGLEGGVTDRR